MTEYLFRGPLLPFWVQLHTGWLQQYSPPYFYPMRPIEIPPLLQNRFSREIEKMVIEFLDDYFRRPPKSDPDPFFENFPTPPPYTFPPNVFHAPVTVRTVTVARGEPIGIQVTVGQAIVDEEDKAAFARWEAVKDSCLKQRLLLVSTVPDPQPYKFPNIRAGANSEPPAIQKKADQKASVIRASTREKLLQLREFRLKYIKTYGQAPQKGYAMDSVDISHTTCQRYDPELIKNWKDTEYK